MSEVQVSPQEIISMVDALAVKRWGVGHGLDLHLVHVAACEWGDIRGWYRSAILTKGLEDLVEGIQRADNPVLLTGLAPTDVLAPQYVRAFKRAVQVARETEA